MESFIVNNGLLVTNLALWGLFGLIVGSIAHWLDPSNVKGGILGTIFTGIIGALLGGFLANMIFGETVTDFNARSILIATAGALLFSFLERLLFKDREKIRTKVTKID